MPLPQFWPLAFATLSFLTGILASTDAKALDYFLEWRFDTPIGETLLFPWATPDSITYYASTGELRYEVSEENQGRWSPPDVASASGAFFTGLPLAPVPLAESAPRFEQNLRIEDQVVIGSNGIRIQYDGLWFWPLDLSDPRILSLWDLDAVPDSHNFGHVLPAGLSESFLQNDLYAAGSGVTLRYVVPEPGSMELILTAIGLLAFVVYQDADSRPE